MKYKPDTLLPRNENNSPTLFPKVWIDDEPKMDNMIYPKAWQALDNLEHGSDNLQSSSCYTLCLGQRAFCDILRVKNVKSTDGNIEFSAKCSGNTLSNSWNKCCSSSVSIFDRKKGRYLDGVVTWSIIADRQLGFHRVFLSPYLL